MFEVVVRALKNTYTKNTFTGVTVITATAGRQKFWRFLDRSIPIEHGILDTERGSRVANSSVDELCVIIGTCCFCGHATEHHLFACWRSSGGPCGSSSFADLYAGHLYVDGAATGHFHHAQNGQCLADTAGSAA